MTDSLSSHGFKSFENSQYQLCFALAFCYDIVMASNGNTSPTRRAGQLNQVHLPPIARNEFKKIGKQGIIFGFFLKCFVIDYECLGDQLVDRNQPVDGHWFSP
jgi:hypothetical protein